MLKYINTLLAAFNIFIFYINKDGSTVSRGVSLACGVLMSLSAIIAAIDDIKK